MVLDPGAGEALGAKRASGVNLETLCTTEASFPREAGGARACAVRDTARVPHDSHVLPAPPVDPHDAA